MFVQQPLLTMDIRPSPRILKVLGEIEFDPWQCIAELADNAFDDLIEIQRAGTHWPDCFKVSVFLPQKNDPQGVVRVIDSGRRVLEKPGRRGGDPSRML